MHLRLHGEDLSFATLWELVERQASYGDKVFLRIEDERLSYAEARELGSRLAAGLDDLGIGRGDVVGTLAYNQVGLVLAWFACSNLGAIYAPYNVSLINDDLRYVLEDTAPKVILVDPRLRSAYDAVRLQLDSRPIEVILETSLHIETALQDHPGYLPFAGLLQTDERESRPRLDGADPLAIIYTGGSTGMPKGVLCSNSLFLGCGLRYRDAIEATSDDIHRSSHHLFHSGGLQNGVVGPLLSGMSSIMSMWFSASKYWDPVREHGVTVIDPIGPLIAALIRQPASELDLKHAVRIGVCAATGQIPQTERAEFERRFGVPLLEVYAQTETGGVLIVTETIKQRREGSAGKAWGWGELRIENERGQECPTGQVGEILFRPSEPSTFMLKYWNKPTETINSWRGLWFRSGDLGYLDEDGWLYFIGRQAHWLRRRGENISAFEVEKVVLGHVDVDECAVVGVPAELGEEDVKVYVVPKDLSKPPAPESVVTLCAEHLAYFKVPRYVEFVETLPKSAAKNEIERHKLRDRGIGGAWDREALGTDSARTRPN